MPQIWGDIHVYATHSRAAILERIGRLGSFGPHCSYLYELDRPWRIGIDVLLNAHAAIVLFFVLSGFVLTRSLLAKPISVRNIAGFYVRRLFRIYPTLVVATLIALVFIAAVGALPRPGLSLWAENKMLVDMPSLAIILVSMTGIPLVLRPAYTIVIEVIGSLLLPGFLVLMRSGVWLGVTLLALLLLLGFAPYYLGPRAVYVMFMVDFAFGAWVAIYLARGEVGVFNSRWILPLSIAGMVLFRAGWGLVSGSGLQPLQLDYHNPVTALGEAVFAAALVGALAARRHLLDTAPLRWLGDISYGLYLLHMTVIFSVGLAVANSPAAGWPVGWKLALLVSITFAITSGLATVLHIVVERPGVVVGRAVARQVEAPKRDALMSSGVG